MMYLNLKFSGDARGSCLREMVAVSSRTGMRTSSKPNLLCNSYGGVSIRCMLQTDSYF